MSDRRWGRHPRDSRSGEYPAGYSADNPYLPRVRNTNSLRMREMSRRVMRVMSRRVMSRRVMNRMVYRVLQILQLRMKIWMMFCGWGEGLLLLLICSVCHLQEK